jgi:hypothetical protein
MARSSGLLYTLDLVIGNVTYSDFLSFILQYCRVRFIYFLLKSAACFDLYHIVSSAKVEFYLRLDVNLSNTFFLFSKWYLNVFFFFAKWKSSTTNCQIGLTKKAVSWLSVHKHREHN